MAEAELTDPEPDDPDRGNPDRADTDQTNPETSSFSASPAAANLGPADHDPVDQDPADLHSEAEAETPDAANGRVNPFIGPRAYQTGEQLYGRERETNQLFNLLMANRVMLLYSPSGAGKSSLIYAALIPELKQEKFNPLPVVRVNQAPPDELANLPGFNRYVFSALSMLEEPLPKKEKLAPEALAQMTLEAYGARFDETRSVLIFDQFEEIMTQDPTDLDAKREFFRQVAALLRHPTLRALFAMREDHLASLDPFKPLFPMLFANPFRLDLLARDTSVQVLQQIAEQEKVDFHKDAAEKLAEDLSQVNFQRPDNTLESRPGLYVEPVQLQVVGTNLWQKLHPDDRDITLAELEVIGDVDDSLGAYYDQQVKAVAEQTHVRERFIREWIDLALITASKIRTQVLRGSEAKYGVSPEAAEALEDARVIRAEDRRGAVWYELAHDRLVTPVKKSNARWFDEHLSLLQKQFRLWKDEETHKGSLLLREAGLEQAQAWAQAHSDELTDDERNFLEQSQQAYQAELDAQEQQQRELEEQKRTSAMLKRRFRIAVVALTVAAVLACISAGLLLYTNYQQQRLGEQEDISKSGNFAGLALTAQQDGYDDLALLLAVQANDRSDSFQSRGALLKLLNANANTKQIKRGHTDRVAGVAVSPDGSQVASVGWDDTLRFWAIDASGLTETRTVAVPDVVSVAYSPTGDGVATAGCAKRDESGANCLSGVIQLWDPATGEQTGSPLTVPDQWVLGVNYSPDGQRLATYTENGEVMVWDLSAGSKPLMIGESGYFSYEIAFNHDAAQPVLATGSCGEVDYESCAAWVIDLWDPATGEHLNTIQGGENWINTLAFSPDDSMLAVGGDDGFVRVWDVATGKELEPAMAGHNGPVRKVAFDTTGSILVSTGDDAWLIFWNLADHTMMYFSDESEANAPTALEAIPNENVISFVSGAEDGRLQLRQIDFKDPLEIDSEIFDFRINDMAVLADSNQVLIASCEDDGDYLCINGMVYAVDLSTHQVVDSFPAGVENVTAIAASPAGVIATGGCTAWQDTSELSDGSQRVCTQAEISLWDAASHQKLDITLDPLESDITDLDFSPDGAYLAAGTRDGFVGVWDTSDWTYASAFYDAIDEAFYKDILTVYGVTFSPDSSRLLIGICRSGGYYETCRNGEVRSVDLTTSSTEEPLRRNGIHPGKLVFGPEEVSGAQMAASLDCTEIVDDSCVYSVTLWSGDSTDVLPMSNLNLQPSWVLSSLALAPDGRSLLTGDYTGLLTWWDVDPLSWREKACQIAGRNLTSNEVSQYKASWEACSQWPQDQ